MQNSIKSSEWIFVISFIAILTSLVCIARLHEHRKKSQLKVMAGLARPPLEVTVSGAVQKPGVYLVLSGARLREAVKKSRPKRFADLSAMDLDQPVKVSMSIHIPELKVVRVRVEGAVKNSVDLALPIGTRLCDLRLKIELSEDADLKFLKRRRFLRDQEIISIPRRCDLSGVEEFLPEASCLDLYDKSLLLVVLVFLGGKGGWGCAMFQKSCVKIASSHILGSQS